MRWLLFAVLSLSASVASACPTCAPAQEASRAWWVLGPFLLVPFLVAGVVLSLLKGHAKLAEPLPPARPAPPSVG